MAQYDDWMHNFTYSTCVVCHSIYLLDDACCSLRATFGTDAKANALHGESNEESARRVMTEMFGEIKFQSDGRVVDVGELSPLHLVFRSFISLILFTLFRVDLSENSRGNVRLKLI